MTPCSRETNNELIQCHETHIDESRCLDRFCICLLENKVGSALFLIREVETCICKFRRSLDKEKITLPLLKKIHQELKNHESLSNKLYAIYYIFLVTTQKSVLIEVYKNQKEKCKKEKDETIFDIAQQTCSIFCCSKC